MFTSLTAFYKSPEWKRFREIIIAERTQEDGFVYDEYSGQPLVKAYDIILHHKEPLTISNVNNPEVSLNPDNIMLVSHASHNEIHNRFGLYIPQKVVIVHGAPLAGKTSFVKSNKSDRDIVVDMDRLWSAITLDPLYVKNNYLKSVIFEARNNLIEQIRMRRGQWQTAWVIGSYPRSGERERLADRLGAELIHIDTSQDECMERLYKAGDRDTALWEQYIAEYFKSFS